MTRLSCYVTLLSDPSFHILCPLPDTNSFFASGSTSLNGPGSLVHLGSLKCIHPQGGGNSVPEGTKLTIYGGCSMSRYLRSDLGRKCL